MSKKNLRPLILTARVTDDMTPTEQFQNGVLRPILKLQHYTILSLFQNKLKQSTTQLKGMEIYQRNEYIQTAVAKNQALKNQYLGLIIGLLTDKELKTYLSSSSEYNKRITQMVIQRIQDSW